MKKYQFTLLELVAISTLSRLIADLFTPYVIDFLADHNLLPSTAYEKAVDDAEAIANA